jgi:Mor family transcriptional regulator
MEFSEMPTTTDMEQALPRSAGTLREMFDVASDELVKHHHLDPHQAGAMAASVIVRWARDFGGIQMYLPRGDSLERLARNLEICRLHDGTVKGPQGINALAQRYGLTEIHIWRVLAKGAKH